ncbi:MAG: ABC transporter permease [Candidatus Hermodarchaeota archaeon]
MAKRKITYRMSRRKRLKSDIRKFFRNGYGLVGFIILITFLLMGIGAPILTWMGVFQPHLGSNSYVGPDYAPPEWIGWFDPLTPSSGNIIPDSNFEKDDSWRFNTSDPPIIEYRYDSDEFVAGTRSIKFYFEDNNNTIAYNELAKGNIDIPWSYREPKNVSLTCNMKVNFGGNLTTLSIYPYLRLKPPSHVDYLPFFTNFDMRPPPHSEWMSFYRPLSFLPIHYLFQPNSTISLEFGVEIREDNPKLVGSVEVWFDKIELHVTSPNYGVLGTNQRGQDIFIQLFWAAQVSLLIAIIAGLSSTGVGVLIGLLAGYKGGLIDNITMRITDFTLIYPTLLILFVLVSQFKPSLPLLIIMITILAWPTTARVIRSVVIVEREKLHIEAAKAAGASDWYIMLHHIMPALIGVIFVQVATTAANVILLEAGLVYLDYPVFKTVGGIYDRRPKRLPYWFSWGLMLAEAQFEGGISIGAWWAVIPPGLCIALLTTSLMFIGYALDQISNPWKSPEARKL